MDGMSAIHRFFVGASAFEQVEHLARRTAIERGRAVVTIIIRPTIVRMSVVSVGPRAVEIHLIRYFSFLLVRVESGLTVYQFRLPTAFGPIEQLLGGAAEQTGTTGGARVIQTTVVFGGVIFLL